MAAKSQIPEGLLPPPRPGQAYVTISALQGGHLTLPEYLFVTDAGPDRRTTVPSLAFLVRHEEKFGNKTTNIVFDLGMKRNASEFPPAMQSHIRNRQPTSAHPDVAEFLRMGGIRPTEIDTVILSHVHWDHVGTPADFPNAQFLVGSGTLHLLQHGAPPHYPADIFIPDLLPSARTREFPAPSTPTVDPEDGESIPSSVPAPLSQQTDDRWQPLGPFPAAIDLFADGSLYIIDSPGHMIGHLNMLARISATRWVYLGGDCCHDIRILEGTKDIAKYPDERGGQRTVHVHTADARQSIHRIHKMLDTAGQHKGQSVEVIVAHDAGWADKNQDRFLPGKV